MNHVFRFDPLTLVTSSIWCDRLDVEDDKDDDADEVVGKYSCGRSTTL
jgi:hypothetical protein